MKSRHKKALQGGRSICKNIASKLLKGAAVGQGRAYLPEGRRCAERARINGPEERQLLKREKQDVYWWK